MTATAIRSPLGTARHEWFAPALLALAAVIVRLPTYLSTRPLSFDDGVYGASTVALRHGQMPYRDVWSSQGPLHLPLLALGDALGLRTVDAPRTAPLLAGVVTTLAVYAAARCLGVSTTTATVVAAITATTGTMLWAAGPVTGDGLAVALASVAVWVALRYRDTPRVAVALLAGGTLGAALATKPIVVAAVVPVAAWLWSSRRRAHVVAAGVAALAVWIAAALPFGLGPVWNQSFAYHRGAGPAYSAAAQAQKLAGTLVTRDALLLAAVALGIAAFVRRYPSNTAGKRRIDADLAILLAWIGAAAAVLVLEKAMFAGHVATIVPPLALLAAYRPPPLRWLAFAAVVVVPWHLVNQRDLLWPRHYSGTDAQVVAALRALPPGAEVIADDPGLVWRAGRVTPPQMNDTTDMRVLQHSLTTATVVAAANRPQTCAVVITPVGYDTLLPDLRGGLRATGYTLAHAYGHDRELWLKRACAPGVRHASS